MQKAPKEGNHQIFWLLTPEKRIQMKSFQLGITANKNMPSQIMEKGEKRKKKFY